MLVGTIIDVTIPKFKGMFHRYKVLNNNLKNDGRGQFELTTLIEDVEGCKIKTYEEGERIIVVDRLWFNEELTGRKIKIIKKP